jgi:exonuclease SbcD
LLLVGNHDVSPAAGRAHAIHEFDTLQVPYVRVLAKPELLQPGDLWDLPVQVIAWPWVSRSGIMAARGLTGADRAEVDSQIENIIVAQTQEWLEQVDPSLPVILTAHASVQGARYGSERTVMLGSDLVLPTSLVCDPRLAYVALGHIHKPQDLNEGRQPPVIYPGSIERVDFGEAADDRCFIIADVARGGTQVHWRKLTGARPFIERKTVIQPESGAVETSSEIVTDRIKAVLPPPAQLEGAILKLTIEYPREYEALIDESALRLYAQAAFEFHLVKHPQTEARVRLPADQTVSSLSPLDLLAQYWRASNVDASEADALQQLAAKLMSGETEGQDGP